MLRRLIIFYFYDANIRSISDFGQAEKKFFREAETRDAGPRLCRKFRRDFLAGTTIAKMPFRQTDAKILSLSLFPGLKNMSYI